MDEETKREAYKKAATGKFDELTIDEAAALLLTSDGRGLKEKSIALEIYTQKILARHAFDQ